MATAVKDVTNPQMMQAETVVVRFAGDSGDGMQLTGGQFTLSTALTGNDLATFPDFPAEIRAPQGTTFGVSSFQIHFGASQIETSGDDIDVLVAMNAAALKVNLHAVRAGGLLICDSGEFSLRNLQKAGYAVSPLDDDSLQKYQVMALDISKLTVDAVKPFGLGNKDALRCKNMWTLGLSLWMFDRDRAPLVKWLKNKFAKDENLANAKTSPRSTLAMPLARLPKLAGHSSNLRLIQSNLRPAFIAPSLALKPCRLGLWQGQSLRASKCFLVAIRSRQPQRFCISSPAIKNLASPPFRPKMKLPRFAQPLAPLMPGNLESHRHPVPVLRLKVKPWGLPS
jgi:2-oxoglutarate/2-oxoacid ferredoxin oxidoreductase subunit alpha